MIKVMVETGVSRREVLRRFGDPYWFQAFGCVLGFDWHSSGLTTVVTGALRDAVKLDSHGIAVVGGKGAMGLRVPEALQELVKSEDLAIRLVKASKLSAKVDNAVLQDGYRIYHHVLIFSEDGYWTVVQQGMNPSRMYARRYHWIGEDVVSFVEEPHSGVVGSRVEDIVLNLTSKLSREARKTSVDLVSENPSKLIRLVNLSIDKQETLTRWLEPMGEIELPPHLDMPRKINWRAIKEAYEMRPRKYEELVEIEGMGPSTLRALALIAALIYGVEIDWRDPVKFTFAHGGKDGVPYPVSRKRMDESIEFLKSIIESANLDRESKTRALKRLLNLERSIYG